MSCLMLCVTPPASIQPRKTYNVLVPVLFLDVAGDVDEPVPPAVQRKVLKLEEYMQRNPEKIPKVSRRLYRKMKAAMGSPKLHGHLKAGAYAYCYLIAHSASPEARYTFAYFAPELLGHPQALIPLMLAHSHPYVKALGAELLAVYTQAQRHGEHSLAHTQALIPQLCALATPRAAAAAAADGPNGASSASASSPSSSATSSSAHQAASGHLHQLRASALHALQQYLSLCQRLSLLPQHLASIGAALLGNAASLADGGALPSPAASAKLPSLASAEASASPAAADAADCAWNMHAAPWLVDGATAALAAAADKPAPAAPDEQAVRSLAGRLLQQFGSFVRSPASAHVAIDTTLRHLDQSGRWGQPHVVRPLMEWLSACCKEQRLPLVVALIQRAASPSLSAAQRDTVLGLVLEQSAEQPLPALALALQALPKGLAAQQATDGDDALPAIEGGVLPAIRQLAASLPGSLELCEALGSALSRQPWALPGAATRSRTESPGRPMLSPAAAEASLQCCAAATGAMQAWPPERLELCSGALPQALLQQLACIIAQAPTASIRQLALQVLTDLLPCIGHCFSAPHQAQAALSIVHSVVTRPNAQPIEFAALHKLSSACIASLQPGAVVAGMQLVRCLQEHTVASTSATAAAQLSEPHAARLCALLMLGNMMLASIAKLMGCPAVEAAQVPLPPPAQLAQQGAAHRALDALCRSKELPVRQQAQWTAAAEALGDAPDIKEAFWDGPALVHLVCKAPFRPVRLQALPAADEFGMPPPRPTTPQQVVPPPAAEPAASDDGLLTPTAADERRALPRSAAAESSGTGTEALQSKFDARLQPLAQQAVDMPALLAQAAATDPVAASALAVVTPPAPPAALPPLPLGALAAARSPGPNLAPPTGQGMSSPPGSIGAAVQGEEANVTTVYYYYKVSPGSGPLSASEYRQHKAAVLRSRPSSAASSAAVSPRRVSVND